MKLKIFIFALFSILLNIVISQRKQIDHKLEDALEFFKERNLVDMVEMTKEQFIDFTEHMLFKTFKIEATIENKDKLKEIIPINMNDVPVKFDRSHLNTYFTQDRIIKIFNDFLRTKFPKEEVDDFEQELENQKKNKNDL